MCRGDVLHEAWKRVRRNKGAAGVDRVTIGEVEQYAVQRFLQELGEVLHAGEYGAQVVRRAYASPARHDPLPGQTSRQREYCVMLRADRPLVSRVREIRMHGLNRGVGSAPGLRAA
jgi:hypothetical protein